MSKSKTKPKADRESLLMAEFLNRLMEKGVEPLHVEAFNEVSFQWVSKKNGSYNLMLEFQTSQIETIKNYAIEFGFFVTNIKPSKFHPNYSLLNFSSKEDT